MWSKMRVWIEAGEGTSGVLMQFTVRLVSQHPPLQLRGVMCSVGSLTRTYIIDTTCTYKCGFVWRASVCNFSCFYSETLINMRRYLRGSVAVQAPRCSQQWSGYFIAAVNSWLTLVKKQKSKLIIAQTKRFYFVTPFTPYEVIQIRHLDKSLWFLHLSFIWHKLNLLSKMPVLSPVMNMF